MTAEPASTRKDCLLLGAAVSRVLKLAILDPNERALMDLAVEWSFSLGLPVARFPASGRSDRWRASRDIEVLTGILRRNQERYFSALERARMLMSRLSTNDEKVLVIEVLPDFKQWAAKLRIDGRVYYNSLAALRVYSGQTQMELLPQEQTLFEALGEVSRETTLERLNRFSNLPPQAEAGYPPVEAQRQDRSEEPGMVLSSGADREAGNAVVAVGKAGGLDGDELDGPLNFLQMVERGWDETQVDAYLKEHPELLSLRSGVVTSHGEKMVTIPLSESDEVSSHGEKIEQGSGPPSSHGEKVFARKSSHGEKIPINTNNVNASSKKHLTMFIGRVRRGETVVERGMSPATLYRRLEETGVFFSKVDTDYRPMWRNYCNSRQIRTLLENLWVDMVKRAMEDGAEFIDTNTAAFLRHRLKLAGVK